MTFAIIPRRIRACCLAACPVIAPLATGAPGQQAVPLIDAGKPAGGWKFGNGPEFPGARGGLGLAAEPFRDRPVLELSGDFTAGGNYVEASIALPEVAVDTLTFWIHAAAGRNQQTVRLVDGSGQCHQIRLKIHEKGGWQQLALPVNEYFRTMGTPAAPDIAIQYEKWGGANDGKWHQPGKLFVLMLGRDPDPKGTVRISDVQLLPAAGQSATVSKVVRLDEMLQAGELDWEFNAGQEFKGATGGLDLVRDQPAQGSNAMRLHGDFTGGGAYVGMRRSFKDMDVRAVGSIRLRMRSTSVSGYGLRLVDGTGQCHQRKNIPFDADGQWREVEIVPTRIAGGEHWGGANDGAWHDPVQLMELMLNTDSHAGRQPELMLADLRAEVVVEARVNAPAFTENFDGGPLPEGWQSAGAVRLDDLGRGGRGKALLLERALDSLRTETRATSPAFAATPGSWQLGYAWKAQLNSPDNSYHGRIDLEALDRTGGLLETIPAGIGHGNHDWQEASQAVTLPPGTARARFRVQLEKTHGSFLLDDLSASPLAGGPVDRRIEKIKLATKAVGNLFLPGDKVAFEVSVEASKPLPKDQQVMHWSVLDYWGAGQVEPAEVALERSPGGGKPLAYTATISLPADALQIGKYYELHVEIPRESADPVGEHTGFAILPPAPARSFEPRQIPFTIRNWDSRIPAYFDLSDRLGLRMIGVWGGWSAKPPYKPTCPGLDRCREMGAGWITGTPAASIERDGFGEYSEESLRLGMKSFLEQYADQGLAMIAMGNEPHGTGEKVTENVRAYRAIYETVKAFDPGIQVIGTSVEPNEEYFKAGYQNYLDSYDFHIYEHYSNVRRTIREYRALMERYNAVKPIHSTELGLNSQGQTRHAVALEMIKKFTVFFAEGGETVSWFTIQYPDPEGKARGQFGDSHCVFDCKYNLYNPRLDAITCYHLVNGICDKKFAAEKTYPNGVQAYLFRDARGGCLQILWRDEGPEDILVPLAAGSEVDLVEVDGTRTRMRATRGGVSLSASGEPVMLIYQDSAGTATGLAASLGPPALRIERPAQAITAGEKSVFLLNGDGLQSGALRANAPLLWKTALRQAAGNQVECTVQAPPTTTAREARIGIDLMKDESVTGHLVMPLRVGRGDAP